MSSSADTTNKNWANMYLWITALAGGLIYFVAVYRLDHQALDPQFAVIAVLAIAFSSRITIRIPQFHSQISVSDVFIFLTLLLYGYEAAIIVAATEALLSSFRFCNKYQTIVFNWGCSAWTLCATGLSLQILFGDVVALASGPISAVYMSAVVAMAVIQYIANSGLVAIGAALQAKQPFWQTWKKHYLWTSITYLAGACAAAFITKLVHEFGFYALVVTLPIIAIVFLTYRTYLKNLEASTSQAEQAQRHVDELSHYIAEQERIREQFSQMEKLSALGELASGVAHDFNNTLAGILGRAQLIQRTSDPEKIARGLSIIIKTAEDGAKTVKRIQDFARQRRDHDFQPVSIDQILFDVSEITRPRWKDRAEASNVQITLDLQIHSKSTVMGDESELREVLVNMVLNAVDAMPDGGRLTLAAEDHDNKVTVLIADTGTGMHSDVKSRIFDPFFTTKGKAGMGLGLAVSFGIIRRHEGSIEVESEVGAGTKFRIVLPKAKIADDPMSVDISAPAVVAVPLAERARDCDANQIKILVVDDEEPIRELLRDLLENEGCRVYLATGSREALALFEAHEFDAIFTDVGMPGMSGWELAHSIRQRNQTIPIAVITGWGEAVGSDDQTRAQVDWVVTKPFRADKISELAGEISNRRPAVPQAALTVAAA